MTPKEYMDKIAATVLDPEVFSAYIEILKENGISMDENTVRHCIILKIDAVLADDSIHIAQIFT